MQFVEISMHEIFCFQDKLDSVKEDPEKVWQIVDSFFSDCENQLELDPGFIRQLQELELEDEYVSVNLDELDEYLESQCGEDYTPSHIDAVKSYLEYKKNA